MSEQRQHARFNVSWRVAIILAGSKQPMQGRTQEVSASGAGIFLSYNLPHKATCTLIFEVPSANYLSRSYVETQAVVIYSSLVGKISEYRTGFQFTKECETFIKMFNSNAAAAKPKKASETASELPPLDDVNHDDIFGNS